MDALPSFGGKLEEMRERADDVVDNDERLGRNAGSTGLLGGGAARLSAMSWRRLLATVFSEACQSCDPIMRKMPFASGEDVHTHVHSLAKTYLHDEYIYEW